ncbi:MAG: LemA family protein [Candidatus Marsarchaeota archaeon]|nr:LemA family protein [Candidatus Marsarchaeota archaeon]
MDIIIIFIIVIIGVFVIIFNTLVMLRNNVRKAWANIDVLLQKRHDLIGRLVETVKGYMQYEKTLLVKITALRTSWSDVQEQDDIQKKMDASNQITNTIKTLFADVENYPNLKADETFMELQKAIIQMEDEIADRREFYNDTVNEYNIKIKIIPYAFFSGMLKYASLPFFQAPEEARKPASSKIS